MEPNLDDISDYNKPLGRKKLKVILIAFAIAIAVYAVYVLLTSEF